MRKVHGINQNDRQTDRYGPPLSDVAENHSIAIIQSCIFHKLYRDAPLTFAAQQFR
jgi:hypothetical protein